MFRANPEHTSSSDDLRAAGGRRPLKWSDLVWALASILVVVAYEVGLLAFLTPYFRWVPHSFPQWVPLLLLLLLLHIHRVRQERSARVYDASSGTDEAKRPARWPYIVAGLGIAFVLVGTLWGGFAFLDAVAAWVVPLGLLTFFAHAYLLYQRRHPMHRIPSDGAGGIDADDGVASR